jgi:phthiodiolone/phenolphthiodiolone dimycocerosates ketoreductase
VWVGGHGPRMLRLTGEYADGWLPIEVTTPADYARMKSIVAEHAAAMGRPEPESGLVVLCVLGESRDHLRAMFEAQPMAKLAVVWVASASLWRKHGLEHPAGDSSRGYLSVIPHSLDPAVLRDLAPRIPFELLEELIHLGNAEEVAARINRFAEAGCEHLVLLDLTGIVGGMAEVVARRSELVTLGRAVARMRERSATHGRR